MPPLDPTTTTKSTTTSKQAPSDYYEWDIYGFTVWYSYGTPNAVWDVLIRDLNFIQNKFSSSLVSELKRKVPIYLTANSRVPSDYPTTHSMIKYQRSIPGIAPDYGLIEIFNFDDFLKARIKILNSTLKKKTVKN